MSSSHSPNILEYVQRLLSEEPNLKVLDLSKQKFSQELYVEVSTLWRESNLFKALRQCDTVERVILDGHDEIDGHAFSFFRKLPSLKEIYFRDIRDMKSPGLIMQIIKCLANGISIHADSQFESTAKKGIINFCEHSSLFDFRLLHKYGLCPPQGEDLTAYKELFRNIITSEDEYDRGHILDQTLNLLRLDYQSEDSFDKNSLFYKERPTSSKEFENLNLQHDGKPIGKNCYILYFIITQLNLWDKILQSDVSSMTLFARNQSLQKIKSHPKYVEINHRLLIPSLNVMREIARAGSFQKYSSPASPSNDSGCNIM